MTRCQAIGADCSSTRPAPCTRTTYKRKRVCLRIRGCASFIMDYETPDGSQFSLREVWHNADEGFEDRPGFAYTTISANVDGKAYYGRLDQRVDEVDEGDVLATLQPVPPEAINPTASEGITKAPPFDPLKHYLKAPSFTWDDCQPGVAFVADYVQNEVDALERLESYHHPNIVRYYGCVVEKGRIAHISLERYQSNIVEYIEDTTRAVDLKKLMQGVKAGIEFLHSLGLAHNDINPENICVVEGRAVIVDFDSCVSFGKILQKGLSHVRDENGNPVSAAKNDIEGLVDVQDFLADLLQDRQDTGPES